MNLPDSQSDHCLSPSKGVCSLLWAQSASPPLPSFFLQQYLPSQHVPITYCVLSVSWLTLPDNSSSSGFLWLQQEVLQCLGSPRTLCKIQVRVLGNNKWMQTEPQAWVESVENPDCGRLGEWDTGDKSSRAWVLCDCFYYTDTPGKRTDSVCEVIHLSAIITPFCKFLQLLEVGDSLLFITWHHLVRVRIPTLPQWGKPSSSLQLRVSLSNHDSSIDLLRSIEEMYLTLSPGAL